eukprot:TRINITY_DN4679_c0_g1_i2.p1 TRINITY_DN4679_c0_g1~~TRINITY_DN4679_c0_g1_i2.p1  ORF type:complete len:198 (-),score=55.18 TRINITY_DN4679_c0_g1_i2:136-729(-)
MTAEAVVAVTMLHIDAVDDDVPAAVALGESALALMQRHQMPAVHARPLYARLAALHERDNRTAVADAYRVRSDALSAVKASLRIPPPPPAAAPLLAVPAAPAAPAAPAPVRRRRSPIRPWRPLVNVANTVHMPKSPPTFLLRPVASAKLDAQAQSKSTCSSKSRLSLHQQRRPVLCRPIAKRARPANDDILDILQPL